MDRTEPIDKAVGKGDSCLVTVGGARLFGGHWQFSTYESFATIYEDVWLSALYPAGANGRRLTVT